MREYRVKVVVSEDKPSLAEAEKRINHFQNVFATVAARYYSSKIFNKGKSKTTKQEG